ncbi:MAG: glutathione S-transferase family protein [Pseudomonadota bacterium]
MIKLYGFPVSNYYNMAKLALLEKGVDFEEVAAMPSQETDFLSKSPMGKVPCIETDQGFISESLAIFDYLESLGEGPALAPSDAYGRAKCAEIALVCKLNIELAARRHYGHLFFGEGRNDAAVEEVKPVMERGLSALSQLADFGPYVMGADFTYADIVLYHSSAYPANVGEAMYQWDIIGAVPGLKECREAIAARPHCQAVDSAWQAALAEFQANS